MEIVAVDHAWETGINPGERKHARFVVDRAMKVTGVRFHWTGGSGQRLRLYAFQVAGLPLNLGAAGVTLDILSHGIPFGRAISLEVGSELQIEVENHQHARMTIRPEFIVKEIS